MQLRCRYQVTIRGRHTPIPSAEVGTRLNRELSRSLFAIRDCLDHVIVLHERHLKRILTRYFDYYHRWRMHLALGMDSPESRPVQLPGSGSVVEYRELGGLHHHYERMAA